MLTINGLICLGNQNGWYMVTLSYFTDLESLKQEGEVVAWRKIIVDK